MREDTLNFQAIEDKDYGPITCHVTTNPQIATIEDADDGTITVNTTEAQVIRDWLTRALGEPDYDEIASEVASEALYHIDQMYPDMWKNVPRTARISLRNIIVRSIRHKVK